MVVYVDELFLLNLVIDYLLILAAALLSGAPLRRGRFLCGALAGAVYACLVFFPELGFLYTLFMKILFSALICLIAFGLPGPRAFLRRALSFFAVSFTFAGGMMALFRLTSPENFTVKNGIFYTGISSGVLIAVSVGVYIIISIFMRASPGDAAAPPGRVTLSISLYGKKTALEAMVDTGNRLYDPLTNARIIVAEYRGVRELFPRGVRSVLDVIGIADAAGTLRMLALSGYAEGFRLVPFSAVGTKSGLLLAVRPDEVREGGRIFEKALIALTDTGLSEETGCGAVIGA